MYVFIKDSVNPFADLWSLSHSSPTSYTHATDCICFLHLLRQLYCIWVLFSCTMGWRYPQRLSWGNCRAELFSPSIWGSHSNPDYFLIFEKHCFLYFFPIYRRKKIPMAVNPFSVEAEIKHFTCLGSFFKCIFHLILYHKNFPLLLGILLFYPEDDPQFI